MEGVEWIWDNGILKQEVVESYQTKIKQAPTRELQETAVGIFEDFMRKLSSGRK
jgi:hypothetical protein